MDADTRSLTSNRAVYYVAISRARHNLTIYTDIGDDDLFPKEVLKSVESMLCAGESRAKQIADRVLVPVPEALSRECAFKVPVALSSAAWEECVEWASRRFTFWDDNDTGSGGGITRHEA